jgi:hypothetical protein
MRSKFLASLLTVLVASLAFAKAKPADLSEFSGKFKGTTVLSLSGMVYQGPSSMVFKAAKKGDRGSLVVTASVSPSGTPVDVGNTFGFERQKKLFIARLAPGIADTVSVNGTYSARKTIVGSGAVEGGTVALTVKIKKTKKSARLTVVYTVSGGGGAVYSETFVGVGKVKSQN